MGFAGAGAALLGCADAAGGADEPSPGRVTGPPGVPDDVRKLFPAKRNTAYTLDRPLTNEWDATHYNNFYEFTAKKELVASFASRFPSRPWQIDVGGLVRKPQTFDVDDLIRSMPMEERLYRLRCVEAWSMAVPWTGFPMRELVKRVEPTDEARYVRMFTFLNPDLAPGQKKQPWYPWPYFEGLRLDEAMNELTLLVTGIYGNPLPNQHGAPLRLICPWKYGFKSIKSIVKIEFVKEQPATFWNTLNPAEYDFWANVNPAVPHPRWSQATERVLGTSDRVPTLPYNGYGQYVAAMYST